MRLKMRGNRLHVVGEHLRAGVEDLSQESGVGVVFVREQLDPVFGLSSWIFRTVSALSHAPVSGRSSRATLVTVA